MIKRSASSCSRPSLWAVGVLAALAVVAIPAAALLAQPGEAPFTIAETGDGYTQGRDKEIWSAFIAVGAEGAEFSSDGLTISGNDARLVSDLRPNTAIVADWTGDRLRIQDNTLGAGLREFERR